MFPETGKSQQITGIRTRGDQRSALEGLNCPNHKQKFLDATNGTGGGVAVARGGMEWVGFGGVVLGRGGLGWIEVRLVWVA